MPRIHWSVHVCNRDLMPSISGGCWYFHTHLCPWSHQWQDRQRKTPFWRLIRVQYVPALHSYKAAWTNPCWDLQNNLHQPYLQDGCYHIPDSLPVPVTLLFLHPWSHRNRSMDLTQAVPAWSQCFWSFLSGSWPDWLHLTPANRSPPHRRRVPPDHIRSNTVVSRKQILP